MEVEEHLVLTGGNSSTLISDGHDVEAHPLWSAKLLKTDPKAIQTVSGRFLDAGAEVVLTCTYQATVKGFVEHMNCSPDEATLLIKNGVRIAKEAKEDFMKYRVKQDGKADCGKPYIIGSVGPYGAYCGDGSEYTGNYIESLSVEELMDWQRPQLQALTSEGVDLIAAETIPALKEAVAVAQVLREFPNTKAWISFSTKDSEGVSHGESWSEVCTTLMRYPQIVGIGINCTSPLNVEPFIQRIQGKTDKKIVVYPNSGELWQDKQWRIGKDKVEPLHCYVPLWLSLGANWIGGCCRTTPDDIAAVRAAVDAHKLESGSSR